MERAKSFFFWGAITGSILLWVIFSGVVIYLVLSGVSFEEVSVCTQTSETTQVCRDEWREVPE